MRVVLEEIGEDPDRDGLRETPMRFLRALKDMTSCSRDKLASYLSRTFKEDCKGQIIAVRDIEFNSLCEHHLMPFYGRIDVAYVVEKGYVLGLSKIPRAVQELAKQAQTQERLTERVRHELNASTSSSVMVRCRGIHTCMRVRGATTESAQMATEQSCGMFKVDPHFRRRAIEMFEAPRAQ